MSFYSSTPLELFPINLFINFLKSHMLLVSTRLTSSRSISRGCFFKNFFFQEKIFKDIQEYAGRVMRKHVHAFGQRVKAGLTSLLYRMHNHMFSTRLERRNKRLLPSLHSVWANRCAGFLTIVSVCIFSWSHPALSLHRGISRCSQILHKGALYGTFPTIPR